MAHFREIPDDKGGFTMNFGRLEINIINRLSFKELLNSASPRLIITVPE